MFDPSLGRWLTADPIGYAGGDVNLYRYEGDNPINTLDPSGLAKQPLGLTVEIVKPPFHLPGNVYTPNGLQITYQLNGIHKIEFIQFKQVSIKYTCTSFKDCSIKSEGYFGGNHTHGDQSTTFSSPGQPIWEIDRGFQTDTPFYPSTDPDPFSPNPASQMEDYPIIAEVARNDVKDRVRQLEELLKRRYPNENGISCTVTVKANFRTYILVDGKVIGHVSWSVSTGSGPSVSDFVPGGLPASLNGIIKDRYPDFPGTR